MIPPRAPRVGSVYLDARGDGRALRVTWHHEEQPDGPTGVVVLSLWRENVCVGTFRMPAEEVPDLVDALRAGLQAAYDEVRGAESPGSAAG